MFLWNLQASVIPVSHTEPCLRLQKNSSHVMTEAVNRVTLNNARGKQKWSLKSDAVLRMIMSRARFNGRVPRGTVTSEMPRT